MVERIHWAEHILITSPPTLRNALVKCDQFHDAAARLKSPIIDLGMGIRFGSENFFSKIRDLLNSLESEVALATITGAEFKLSFTDDGQLCCKSPGTVLLLPDSRVLSNNPEVRHAGLSAIAKNVLPSDAYDSWRKVIHADALSDAEMFALSADISDTPSGCLSNIDASAERGQVEWAALLPTSKRYRSRLIGDVDEEISLDAYANRGLAQAAISLSHLPRREKWKRSFALCGHPDFTKALPFHINSPREANAIIDWARGTKSPIPMVAVAEYMLRQAPNLPIRDEPTSQLINDILDLDPSDGAPEYKIFSDLLLSLDGQIARSRSLSRASIFYRRLLASSQAAFLQTFLHGKGQILPPMAQAACRANGLFGVIRGVIDLKDSPRWEPDLFSPEAIFSDHLGRLVLAAPPLHDLQSCPCLSTLFDREAGGRLHSKLKWPSAFMCGYLEGDRPPSGPLPESWAQSIDDQLAERPVTARSLIALINAVPFGAITDLQIEALLKALSSLGLYLLDIKQPHEIDAILKGLASLATIKKAPRLANALVPLMRRHFTDVEHATEPNAIFRYALLATGSFSDEQKASSWLADQAEFLAFSDLDEKSLRNLRDDIEVACQVEPSLRVPLTKARIALQAACGV